MISVAHRPMILMIVLASHAAIFTPVSMRLVARGTVPTMPRDEVIMSAQFLVSPPEWDESPAPDVGLRTIPTDLNDLKMIQFTDPDPEDLDGIVASASAPHLARVQTADPAVYALRARILAGHPRTVILTLEVLATGLTGSATVIRGCGDLEVDAIAVEYARQLKWMPGTTSHEPRNVRIVFPVTLAVPT